jgi:hypothetical protein
MVLGIMDVRVKGIWVPSGRSRGDIIYLIKVKVLEEYPKKAKEIIEKT